MRLYSFTNFMLSSIQHGIQTAHIMGEILIKNDPTPYHNEITLEWLSRHKTIIVCNGGNSKSITELYQFFAHRHNKYPFASFNEDTDSLNGALTGVGIVLPPEIYDVKTEFVFDKETRERKKVYEYMSDGDFTTLIIYDDPTDYTYQLIDKIKSAPLAR